MFGAVAGMVAGLAFAMFEMVMAAILGDGFFMPLRMIGAVVLGEDALMATYSLAAAATAGVIVHMLLSALYGAAFGMALGMAPGLRHNAAALVGLATVYGFLLWIVNFYVIAPLAFEWFGMADTMVQFVAHTFFFGSALGLVFLTRTASPRGMR